MTVQELRIDDRFKIAGDYWRSAERGHYIGKGHDKEAQRVVYKIVWVKDKDPRVITEKAYTCNEIVAAVEQGYWEYAPQTHMEEL